MTRTFALALALAAALTSAYAQKTGTLTFQADGATKARLGYYPVPLPLDPVKPSQVKKEPAYRSAPLYATLRAGNGPKSLYVIALDEPEGADGKIYIDLNQNGDLTDDGDGAWNKKSDNNGRVMYGVMDVALRASYGDSKRERSSAPHTVGLYRFAATPNLLMYRQGARVGTVAIDGKPVPAMLVENDGDGLFAKPVAKIEDAQKTRPVWLLLDTAGDGKWSKRLDIRAPFDLDGKAYEAKIAPDGSTLQLSRTKKAIVDLNPKPAPTKPLLAAGTTAPDFVAEKWGGGDMKLSDYRGKIVILDFWATWCGPCQKSMPHIESVYQKVKDQGVAVLGVAVWDEKAAYEKWVPANKEKYTFEFSFDPAGRSADSIAGKLFNVTGIPTTYVIDRDGKVVGSVVGYDDGDKRLEEILTKIGLKVD